MFYWLIVFMLHLCLVFENLLSRMIGIQTQPFLPLGNFYNITPFVFASWFVLFWIQKLILIHTRLPLFPLPPHLWVLLTDQNLLILLHISLRFWFWLQFYVFLLRFLPSFVQIFLCKIAFWFLYGFGMFWLMSVPLCCQLGYHFASCFRIVVWFALSRKYDTGRLF